MRSVVDLKREIKMRSVVDLKREIKMRRIAEIGCGCIVMLVIIVFWFCAGFTIIHFVNKYW
jgi:hypothetical protein